MFQDFLIFPKNLDDFQAAALHPNPHPPRPRLVRMARRRKIMSALLLLYSAVAAITWTFKASRWGSCNQCSMSSQSLRTLSCLRRDIDNGRVFRGIVPRTLGASIIVFSHCVCWNVGKSFYERQIMVSLSARILSFLSVQVTPCSFTHFFYIQCIDFVQVKNLPATKIFIGPKATLGWSGDPLSSHPTGPASPWRATYHKLGSNPYNGGITASWNSTPK